MRTLLYDLPVLENYDQVCVDEISTPRDLSTSIDLPASTMVRSLCAMNMLVLPLCNRVLLMLFMISASVWASRADV